MPRKTAAAEPRKNESRKSEQPKKPSAGRLAYPPSPTSEQTDDYHGTKIVDRYRPLEDPDSPATRAWIEAENKLTFGFLSGIAERPRIQKRLTELWNYERFTVPEHRGGRYFYTRNDGLQNQNVVYAAASLESEPKVLLDPNTLSADGTIALSGHAPSYDGRLLAYGLSTAGSDWQEWKVRDVETGRDRSDHLKWIKFSSVSWTPDDKGFFYSRYDEPTEATRLTATNYYQKLLYHRLGTPQSLDTLVYERRDEKEWGFRGQVTDDGRFVVVEVWRGTDVKNQIFYRDLEAPEAKFVELIAGFDAQYQFVGSEGSVLWFRSDLDAPRGRLIAIDTARPERSAWRDLVAQSTEVLEEVHAVGRRFFCIYLEDAHNRVRMFDFEGKPAGELKLPGLGSTFGFSGRQNDEETFYAFTSFTVPTEIYRLHVPTQKSTLFRRPKADFAEGDYETRQVFCRSKDGTRIPIFIIAKKGLDLSGDHPTLLYGYGGFNISITPDFHPARLVWLEMGGVYAVATLRGGGEYGRSWHDAGRKASKQNVFDDFLASAQWLIASGYTSPRKLAITGRSNGGLLVGACLVQRPDLFAAALPAVGVMDMLRFQRFTIGWAWVPEYGSADDPQDFPVLRRYSPLHNLRDGTRYPATFISTADHDDRVVPAHSFKFAAALQAAQGGDAPILIRIETRAGHGAGKPTKKQIEELADSFSFLVTTLGMKIPRPFGAHEGK